MSKSTDGATTAEHGLGLLDALIRLTDRRLCLPSAAKLRSLNLKQLTSHPARRPMLQQNVGI